MALHYVNLNDSYCRDDFIHSAPNVDRVVENLTPLDSSQFLSDDDLRKMVDMNTSSESITDSLSSPPAEQPKKRIYAKVSQSQLDVLQNLYNVEGPNYPLSKYCEVTGIKKKRVQSLLSQLKKDIDINKSTVKKGRNRLLAINESTLLSDIVNSNNRTTLKQMKDILHDNDINVSVSTIHRHLNERMVDYDLPNITLKRYVPRQSPEDQIENLKTERITVIKKKKLLTRQGYHTV